MSAHSFLLQLFGSVALLIWATRMVKTGIIRGFEARLRGVIRAATASPVRGALAGIGVATALQSSTATGLLLVSFAERGLIALAPALAVMLGADIGSTIVVQALSFDLSAAIPVLLLAGVVIFMNGKTSKTRQIGRILIGLALMVLSLQMIVAASAPLRDSNLLDMVLQNLVGDPIVAVLIGALLTWLVHSSVAMILLFMTLGAAGVLPVGVALMLVLGANVGSGLIPIGLTAGSGTATRRVLYGNLAFRFVGVLIAMAAAPWLLAHVEDAAASSARLIANFHTGFNVALALVFLPCVGLAARLLHRVVPEAETPHSPARPVHLDEALLDRPGVALGAATREVMRLADLVEMMMRDAIRTFETGSTLAPSVVASQDNAVDDLEEAIKLYLTRLSRRDLEPAQRAQCYDLIVFTTNLEHIGDIIDKSLLVLANKKRREKLHFSEPGWRDIRALHEKVIEQMRLAVTVFVTRDSAMAQELVANKDEIRRLERLAMESHLGRLRDGTPESIESSSVHLDVIRDLKRINAHITATAYPILEALGQLRQSRLKSA